MYPRVAIIILNWNGWEDTLECLESLNNMDYPNYYLILVDNASRDNSLNMIRNYCDGKTVNNTSHKSNNDTVIDLLEVDYNELSRVKLDQDLFINSDRLEKLILVNNDENYGFTEGNNIAMRFGLKNLSVEYFLLLNNDTVVDESYVEGSCMLVSTDLIHDVGLFNPDYFTYWE